MRRWAWWRGAGSYGPAGVGLAIALVAAIAAVSAQAAPFEQTVGQGAVANKIVKPYSVQMPNLGVSRAEAEAVLAYLDAQTAAPAGTSPAPLPQVAGNPALGREYFSGARRFQNGGPPCMACHSVAGIGALGGGALGPDLTQASTKYGEAGIGSILATLPFPTMNPIFSTRPLTPGEQASLKAFLQQTAVTERPVEAIGQLAGLAVAGAVVLVVLAHLVWRDRLVAVRRPMLRRAR